MGSTSRRRISKYSTVAGIAGFALQPIPGADELIVVSIQYALSASKARQHGVKITGLPWARVNKIVWGGAAIRLVAGVTLGLIPFAGAFSNAITAFASTELLGRYLDHALKDPDAPPPPVSVQGAFAAIRSAIGARRQPRA